MLPKVPHFQMEVKKNHKRRKAKSATGSGSSADIRKQIESISKVSGSNQQPQRFHRKEQKEAETPVEKTLVRRMKNINLYEDDLEKSAKRRSASLEVYAEDHEIIADIKTMNAGVSHSNQRIETNWGLNERSSEPAGSSFSGDSEEINAAILRLKRDEEKYKNNVLMSSLLKQRIEETIDKSKPDKTSNNDGTNAESKSHHSSHVVQDPTDTDFYYRRTTVADSDADYTVEHVGKVNVIPPVKYVIENVNDDDFTFRRRNPRRSTNSSKKDNQS